MTSLLIVSAAAGAVLAVWFWIRNYRRRWVLVSIRGDFTTEHHLPDEIPVPRAQANRVGGGEVSLDEAVDWIRQFVAQRKRHPMRGEYQRVLRKCELYRELSEKMGRGQWRDVLNLGQRLAEIDPLDPSAAVYRGRALREMGNFPGAIRFYQQALALTPFHSSAFPEMAATCRAIGQPGRFRDALEKARRELGDTHPLTIEGRIQLGELIRVYADPTDPATVAHVPREQYLQNIQARLDDMTLDPTTALQVGQTMLQQEDLPELAERVVERASRDFGDTPELLLLQAMIEHYRMNHEAAERLVMQSLEREDSAAARFELGKIFLEQSLQVEDPAARADLDERGRQQLRLAVDRDTEQVDAVALLVEKGWSRGIEGVVEELQPLIKAYPQAWSVWRVLGDAHMSAEQYDQAIESYQKGLKQQTADQLLLPCLSALEQANRRGEMLALARGITNLSSRDPQLRWKVAQTFCEHQRMTEARKILQQLVDDEHVSPPLRQRANDVLDHLDHIERQQQKRENKPRKSRPRR